MMQVAARGPDSLRGRSRSPEGRYGRDPAALQGNTRRVVHAPPHESQEFSKWREEDLGGPRPVIPPGPRMYSSLPLRPKVSERITGGSRLQGGESDDVHGAGYEWNEMLTFRTFVIMRVSEEASPSIAVDAYDQYKKAFHQEREPRFLWFIKDFPVMTERYHPDMLQLEFEEVAQRCRAEASQFVKMLAEERFFGLSLVERADVFRSISDTDHAFRLNVGRSIDPQNFSSLTAPFWFPVDPDLYCLCLRKLPSQLSKWDLKDYAHTDAESFVDVAVTEPPDFQLTLHGGSSHRTAWIRFVSDEACSAAELKLDGATVKDTKLHVLRRVPNTASYTCRVAPSETCHPARILRDLILSARLILKLDHAFGVTELLGGAPQTESFEASCAGHPVLSELHLVFTGASRSAEEQLDLQLLYLRVVHCVCYYSGRRYRSPRHLWEATGGLYVRPYVNSEDVTRAFRDFETADGGWDRHYAEAADLMDPVALSEAAAGPLFLDETTAYPFEPLTTDPPHAVKEEVKKRVKQEMETDMDEEETAADVPEITSETTIKTELKEDLEKRRGRGNPWLTVLDNRIARLLSEELQKPSTPITEENATVQERWNAFCDKVAAEKWRCGLCAKMFRGVEFVKKHLKNKHAEHLNSIIPEVRDELLLQSYQTDPFRLPIAPPVITPYVYRRGLPNYQYESPTLGPAAAGYVPPTTVAGDFNAFMPGAGGSRLGVPSGGLQYRDLDAPRPSEASTVRMSRARPWFLKQGLKNVRDTISYDDL